MGLELRAEREHTLIALYEVSRGGSLYRTRVMDVAEAAQRPEEEIQGWVQNLVQIDYASSEAETRRIGPGSIVSLTEKGMNEAERLLQEREDGPTDLPIELSWRQRSDLEPVVQKLVQLLERPEFADLDEDDRLDLQAQVHTVQAQQGSPRASRRILHLALAGIGLIAVNAAGNALGAPLQDAVGHGLRVIESL